MLWLKSIIYFLQCDKFMLIYCHCLIYLFFLLFTMHQLQIQRVSIVQRHACVMICWLYILTISLSQALLIQWFSNDIDSRLYIEYKMAKPK